MASFEPIKDTSPSSLRKLNDQLRFLFFATRNIRTKDIRPEVAKDLDLTENPCLVNLPTNDEKDALQGTYGNPSNSNRYVTKSDPSMTNARTPLRHGDEAHIEKYMDYASAVKLKILGL